MFLWLFWKPPPCGILAFFAQQVAQPTVPEMLCCVFFSVVVGVIRVDCLQNYLCISVDSDLFKFCCMGLVGAFVMNRE